MKDCDPRQFRLLETQSSQTVCVVAEFPFNFTSELVKVGMEFVYSAINCDHQLQFPVFKATLKELVKAGRAVMKGERCVELQLQSTPTGLGQLEVTLLGVQVQVIMWSFPLQWT